jgi:hypothetical protein
VKALTSRLAGQHAGPRAAWGAPRAGLTGSAGGPQASSREAGAASSNAELTPRVARAAAVACSLLAALLWLGPTLVRDDLFNGDASQHVFWYYRYADPTLFPNDLSVAYFSSPSETPIGYRALLSTLAPYVDVLHAAEWLSLLPFFASALLAFLVGRAAIPETRYRELGGLFAVVALLVALPSIDLLPAIALQRTYAMPLTLLCLWAYMTRRYVWGAAGWLGAALLYPVLLPVLGLVGVIMMALDAARRRALPPHWPLIGALGAAAIAIVGLRLGMTPGIGPAVPYAQAITMPEFAPGGRQELTSGHPLSDLFLHHRTGIGVSAEWLLAGALAAAAAVAAGRRRFLPPAALILGASGLAVWALARLSMFMLYLPNRHSRWTVAAAVVTVIAAGAVAVLAKLRERRRFTAAPRVRGALALCGAPAIVALALLPGGWRQWTSPVNRDLENAYAFIATLPSDTLVAAHPDLASYVPLRSRRSVLASTETGVAFMEGYYRQMRPRIEASLDAAYATDWNDLDAALAPFGASVMLSDAAVLDHPHYRPPYDKRVAALTQGVDPRAFVLRDPPADRVLFRSGDTVVVAVRSPVAGAAGSHVAEVQ